MDGPDAPKPSRVGYFALALVVVGMPTFFVGGFYLMCGGMFMAAVMVFADARDGRRVSRPAIWALVLGPAWLLLFYGCVWQLW